MTIYNDISIWNIYYIIINLKYICSHIYIYMCIYMCVLKILKIIKILHLPTIETLYIFHACLVS